MPDSTLVKPLALVQEPKKQEDTTDFVKKFLEIRQYIIDKYNIEPTKFEGKNTYGRHRLGAGYMGFYPKNLNGYKAAALKNGGDIEDLV